MSASPRAELGIIGGSGLYDMEGLTDREELTLSTPFGEPSGTIVLGILEGRRLAFVPRHGAGHRLSPSEVPFRANIFALKTLGVHSVISISAVGSLREEIQPLDMIVPDQVIDRTRGRPSTFFSGGIVAHAGFADPFCTDLGSILYEEATAAGARAHLGGVLCGHGRASVFHARRVGALPLVGRRGDRHDRAARGQAGPRGGSCATPCSPAPPTMIAGIPITTTSPSR